MVKISTAGNSDTAAYSLLRENGFDIDVIRMADTLYYRARRGEDEFIGSSPLELLGLSALADARGMNWQASDEDVESLLRLDQEASDEMDQE